MKKMSADEIRDTWLKFFASKGHFVEPSASLIPHNDPTLLWINAGVAALKKYFDGSKRPEHRRITNAQKCIRTNDIENVGHTARHQTFFEMLGNFSIGDYFRAEVIPWACELLLDEKYYGLPADKLYISYYPDDEETKNLWIKNGIASDHLIPLKTNFWEIGQGPCGPDTEIYFDRGEKYDPDNRGIVMLKNDEDNERYVELWNIVFSQFNADPKLDRAHYKELPQKNIDTGAGLERLACVMQGVDTNFETDLFVPLIHWIELRTKKPYEGDNKLAYRVIADHVRSVTFALADGASFSNEGRGYVLRRLIRRAGRFANQLDLPVGSLSDLVDVVVKSMNHFYPYLKDHREQVKKMVRSEEEKFAKTLKQGEHILLKYLERSEGILSGKDAFMLSDTFGFPVELTSEICAEKGVKVDMKEYQKQLESQRQKAREARGKRVSFASQSKDLIEFILPSTFNYEPKPIQAKVIGIFKDGLKQNFLEDEGDIILDETNFYAESGGQVADVGTMTNDQVKLEVSDVQKAPNKQFLHHVKLLYGQIEIGDRLTLNPDFARRQTICKNHSSCHLLQAALQKEIAKDVHQAGSFVNDEELRFDFTFNRKLTQEELNRIESDVNAFIRRGVACKTEILDKDQALKTGAMALFSEKYGSKVRVVSFGDISKEFCAGTHVGNTKDIGLFVIGSESAIASGVRRIVAYTGQAAYEFLKEKQGELDDVAQLLEVMSDREILTKIKAIYKEREEAKRRINELEGKIVSTQITNAKKTFISSDGYHIYPLKVSDFTHAQEVDTLKEMVKDELAIAVIFNVKGKKNSLAVAVGSKAINKYKAGNLVRKIALKLNGSGGGKPDMAFGGFENAQGIDQVLTQIKEIING